MIGSEEYLQTENVHLAKPGLGMNDNALIERCKSGDTTAMERLILKYQDRLYNTLLRMCGNEDDAAELSQETFVKAIESIRTFEGRSTFYTWLCRIGMNLAADLCKKRLRIGSSLDSDSPRMQNAKVQMGMYLNSGEQDPARLMQTKEALEMLQTAILKLDEDLRVMIVLRDIEEMNYSQISQMLGLELGTVKSRISRARKILKEILEVLSQ